VIGIKVFNSSSTQMYPQIRKAHMDKHPQIPSLLPLEVKAHVRLALWLTVFVFILFIFFPFELCCYFVKLEEGRKEVEL